MIRRILLAAFVALVVPSVVQGRGKSSFLGQLVKSCFPDNATKATCFAELPNAAHMTSSMLNFLLPRADVDSYVIDGVEDFDAVDFTVGRVEQNPKYLCQHNTTFIEALSCLTQSVKTKCPFLPDKMLTKYDNIAEGFQFVCSRLDEIDSTCMHQHWSSYRPCHKQALTQVKAMFEKRGSKERQSNQTGKMSTPKPDNNTNTELLQPGIKMVACYFQYHMSLCIKELLESCHGPTAKIMFEFARLLASPNCTARMVEWDRTEASKLVNDCRSDRCGGASPSTPVVMVTNALFLAMAFMKMIA